MPTFSFTSSGVMSSHGQGPAPSSASVPIVSLVSETTSSNKKKKQRTSKKQMKNNAPPSSLPTSTENPITLEEYPNVIDNHNHVTYTALKDEVDVETMNDDDLSSEPTFPDIVILKQTDKNYIVKHNHYPITNSENKKIDETSITIKNKNNNENNFTDNTVENSDLVSPNQIYKGQINKKRGRKPKAGMILSSNSSIYDTSEVPNIILHLKCHLNDLKINESISNYDYTPSISEVESYNILSNNLQSSDICQTYSPENDQDDDDDERTPEHTLCNYKSLISQNAFTENNSNYEIPNTSISGGLSSSNGTGLLGNVPNNTIGPSLSSAAPSVKKTVTVTASDATVHVLNERHQKDIVKKLNRLKYSFHNGETIQMKLNHKCSCFWDTCEFDGPIYYVPIMIVNGVFQVSGCFCSPECALASILKEHIDTSSKFERIHLLHLLYGNSSNKGFKPAPNPNYLLDRYYGNLTIDEYRSLLKGPQIIHIVNKPLTHILPELYEDNNDFLVNSKVIPTNNLKLKKRYKTMVVQGSGVD